MTTSYSIRPGEITLKLNPKETCLLVIDMQNGFGAPDGSFGRFDPDYPKTVQKVVPTIRKALDFCHEVEIPVVYTRQVHVTEFFAAGLHALIGRELVSFREAGVRICHKGTSDTEILDALKPTEKDYVIEKNKPSAFYNTWLELWLRYFHTKTIIITGCNTGYCVMDTVYDSFKRDFDVIVVEDGVNDPVPHIHSAVLEQIDRRFGRVLKWDLIQDVISKYPEDVKISGAKP